MFNILLPRAVRRPAMFSKGRPLLTMEVPMSGRKFGGICLENLAPLTFRQAIPEILAGLTLAAIAIPEVMGYTKIAGTPVVTGLYTLLLPMALFALFGSSRHLVVGADSATAAILATSLAGVAMTGSAGYVALACLLALMVGLLLLVASVTRIAFMADFLSRTVLTGFLTGVGIQVSMHSLTGMAGLPADPATGLERAAHFVAKIGEFNPVALAIAVGVLAAVAGLKAVSGKFPGPIVALGLATLLSGVLSLKDHVAVVGKVPSGLPALALPDVEWSPGLIWQLGPTALAMLVVILAQSAATARAYATKYNEPLDEATDLRALGLANLGAGLTGTFMVNGSPTKSRMVERAGGRTQLSMLVTALVVLLMLVFFTGLIADLPEAALSALVFLIGIDLIDIPGLKRIYRTRRPEFWVSVFTIAVVVAAGVGPGIVLAIVLSLIVHTRHGYRPVNVLLARVPSGGWHAQPLASGAQAAPGLIIYRFTHTMYYANADRMAAEIRKLTTHAATPPAFFSIDFSCIDDVDFTALETLKQLQRDLAERQITLLFVNTLDDPGALVRRELVSAFGERVVFATVEDLVEHTGALPPAGEDGPPAS